MSGFGEIIASAVGKQILSKLSELAKEEATLQWRFKDDVDDMVEKMQDLEAVLHDADDRQRRGGSDGEVVGRWLTKFKCVAYDVEQVLDEVDASELLRKSQPKRVTMPHKLKNVRKKIEKIGKEGQALKLVQQETRAETSIKNESFAGISDDSQKQAMVGRDVEKDKIISLLLRKEANEDISIIPIVGLGGLGKTTLAESVYADKKVNDFDVYAWVHVSKEFDLHKIGSAILKSINSSINLDNCRLQFLQDNLKKELATTSYLIVLDDLWEEDGHKLERLKQMLQHGRKGSKVILTTRNQSIVAKLSTGVLANQRKIRPVPESDQINLGVLSTEHCWEVIKQTAFGPDDDLHTGLEEIGRQIAEKCGGVPLVANALGQVMSELRTVEAWEKIKNTNIDLGSRDHKDTLERLMLSYYYMKLEFKMCFTYLATFTKGFVMDSDRLIQQWKALGYIKGEDDGIRCINYLLWMSFLQISRSSWDSPSPAHAKAPRELSMHDLVHDLATIIMGNEFIVVNASEPRTLKKGKHHYCRHVQLINYQNQYKIFKDLPAKIRSFHVRDSGNLQLPKNAFSRSKYIRVLDLSGCLVEEQSAPCNILLPSSLQMKLLRYFDATGLQMRSLPMSFHTLQNMQTLILSNCSLETLPDSVCSLQKLSYLDLSENTSLNKLPDKFGFLNNLIFLNMSRCSKLAKLPENVSLVSLENLNLSGCHEFENMPKDISNLQNLRYLNLSDCYKVSMLPESLCQLKNLRDLDLSDCHNLDVLPKCFGNLLELESLNLTSCPKLGSLPESFGTMVKLKYLNLSYCIRLRELPSSIGDLKLQVLDISASSLRYLPESISNMTTLTQFVVTSGHHRMFGKAQEVKRCLNLPGRVVHRVQKTDTRGCSNIVELTQLNCRELLIRDLENMTKLEDAERARLRDKSCLRQLVLRWNSNNSENMKNGADESKSVLERLIPPRTLEQFMIHGYLGKDFPNSWMSHISSYLPCLTYLSLTDFGECDNLPPFGQLPNLRSLYMQKIPNVTKIGKEFYGEGGTCKKLRLIQLQSMENLAEWWTTRSGKEDEDFLIPNLHNLELKDCPKLKFLPYPPKSMFWFLNNSAEVLPGQGFGNLSSPALPYGMGINKCDLCPDKWHRLQHLPTLEVFSLTSCSGLRALPQDILCFTSLRKLSLCSLKDLETLPEWLGNLTALQYFGIQNCYNLTFFPDSMKNLSSLQILIILECEGVKILPEWLGQLMSLQELSIGVCPNITSLPKTIRNLTTLEELYISGCPNLVKRCRREDADMISHILKVTLKLHEEPEGPKEEEELEGGLEAEQRLEESEISSSSGSEELGIDEQGGRLEGQEGQEGEIILDDDGIAIDLTTLFEPPKLKRQRESGSSSFEPPELYDHHSRLYSDKDVLEELEL